MFPKQGKKGVICGHCMKGMMVPRVFLPFWIWASWVSRTPGFIPSDPNSFCWLICLSLFPIPCWSLALSFIFFLLPSLCYFGLVSSVCFSENLSGGKNIIDSLGIDRVKDTFLNNLGTTTRRIKIECTTFVSGKKFHLLDRVEEKKER